MNFTLFFKLQVFVCMFLCMSWTFVLAEGDGYGANNGGNSGTSVTDTIVSQLTTYAGFNSAYNITVSGTIVLGVDGRGALGSNTTLQGANTNAAIIGTVNIEGVVMLSLRAII